MVEIQLHILEGLSGTKARDETRAESLYRYVQYIHVKNNCARSRWPAGPAARARGAPGSVCRARHGRARVSAPARTAHFASAVAHLDLHRCRLRPALRRRVLRAPHARATVYDTRTRRGGSLRRTTKHRAPPAPHAQLSVLAWCTSTSLLPAFAADALRALRAPPALFLRGARK